MGSQLKVGLFHFPEIGRGFTTITVLGVCGLKLVSGKGRRWDGKGKSKENNSARNALIQKEKNAIEFARVDQPKKPKFSKNFKEKGANAT